MTRGLAAAAAVVVVSAGTAWAAGLTLTSAHLGASSLTSPVMFPVSVTLANKTNGTVGKVQSGDTVTFVWSQPVDETTLCSGWSNASSTQLLTLQWSVVNGASGADDTLQATGSSATCATGLHVGTVDLGSAGYDTGSTAIDFTTTTNALTVGSTTTTLVVTLGGGSAVNAGTVASGNAAVWTPDSAVKDRSARTCRTNLAKSSSTVQF
ncbi:MAG: hypothetical protein QOD07_284 [Frankiaceae bacterium]|jgi:hypothetical protein|nr:hypothetical protein [Frankiaceae bacterium]